jgi:hypothetical protein
MADNSVIPVSVGTETFANNDVGGVKYPRVKLVWGAAGAVNDASAANPIPITGTVTSNAGDFGRLIGTPLTGTEKINPTVIRQDTPGAIHGDLMVSVLRLDANGWLRTQPNITKGAGNVDATTTRVTIDQLQLGSLIRTSVPVVTGGYKYKAAAAGATTALETGAGTGAIGDYLETLVCVVNTPATSQVRIGDGITPATEVLPNAVAGAVGTYHIALGILSTVGSWRVTTGAGVTVFATGNWT